MGKIQRKRLSQKQKDQVIWELLERSRDHDQKLDYLIEHLSKKCRRKADFYSPIINSPD